MKMTQLMRRAVTRRVRRRIRWRRGFLGVGGLIVSVVVCSGRPVLMILGLTVALMLIVGAVLIS